MDHALANAKEWKVEMLSVATTKMSMIDSFVVNVLSPALCDQKST